MFVYVCTNQMVSHKDEMILLGGKMKQQCENVQTDTCDCVFTLNVEKIHLRWIIIARHITITLAFDLKSKL